MLPPALALGLTLCDYVLIEEGTRRVSLIGTLTRVTADRVIFRRSRCHSPSLQCLQTGKVML